MFKINIDKVFDILVHIILILFSIIMLYPIYFTVIASLSEPSAVVQGKVVFWLKEFTAESYRIVFERRDIWMGYKNSILYTVFGTLLSMCLTIPAAFAMSRKNMWMRNFMSFFFLIPMYISGGLLPYYLQVRNLGLLNQPYTQIVLGSLSIYNMIVARSYFQNSIPDSLFEAAEIDGASILKQFRMIALPLAKPVMAVLVLYYATSRWNNYMHSVIYVNDSAYHSLQYVLRTILTSAKNALAGANVETMKMEEYEALVHKAYLAEGMKYAVIIVASLPMLILYPFIQKYFVKGVMIGSLKG